MSTGEQFTDGELVLAPYTFYKSAIDDKEDLTKKNLIIYKTNLVKAGTEKSVVTYMEDYELPNSLIIGLPEGATAKKGDIVLTWWQTGSGMNRAIVRDDSNPAEPKVDYLDMSMSIQRATQAQLVYRPSRRRVAAWSTSRTQKRLGQVGSRYTDQGHRRQGSRTGFRQQGCSLSTGNL